MRVVVCGATGFVGRAFVKHLVAKGHGDVVAVSRHSPSLMQPEVDYFTGDLRDPDFAMDACRGAQMVFNLAAEVGGIGYISDHKVDCLLSSLINTNLLRACETHQVMRYFFASSSCVYPICNLPLCEADAFPAMPSAGYGWEKLFGEQMCLAFNEEKRVPCTIARFHTLYGPGDNRPAGREHVVEALCKKVIDAKLSGSNEISIWGDGKQTRSMLYVDDCVEGMWRLAAGAVRGPVNLANRYPISVNQIVDYLEQIAAVKLTRFYSAEHAVGLQHKTANINMLRDSLNWEPMTCFKDGLQKTYNWLWEHSVCHKS